MNSIFYGLLVMVVISVFAWAVMDTTAVTSGEQFTSPNNSVRLD